MIALFATALAAGLNMPCEQLASVKLERASITAATTVAEGIFTPPPGGGPPPPANAPPPEPIPEHCKVTMVLKPTSDSNINVELWLPTKNWNGKFLAVGNGGWAGAIQGWGDMQVALRRGYATAGTDTGHSAEGATCLRRLPQPLQSTRSKCC